jgi:hypothetical protein
MKSVVRELTMSDLVGGKDIKWKKSENKPSHNNSTT